jgi:predicted nuclease of predicted toxin-antitoxin system
VKFFFDENFPKSAGPLLMARGHECVDIRGTGKEGAEDLAIFQLAQEQRAVFLTTDRDFFHTIPHLEKNHHGVVVVALRQPNRQSILSRLEWFLQRFEHRDIGNRVFELRDRTFVVFPNLALHPPSSEGEC